MGSKIGLGGPLGGSSGHLRPNNQTRPPRLRRRASKGLLGSPKLGAKMDPKQTKLRPNGAQVGDFVHLCLQLCAHVGPRTYQSPIRGPIEAKMLPKCAQHAMAEGHEMRGLPIRNTLVGFGAQVLLEPHLHPLGLHFPPQSWTKFAPRVGFGRLLENLGMHLGEVLGGPGGA